MPYPPNYGGVIDVFYRLKALSEQGVKIILHIVSHHHHRPAELHNYCEKVYYYPRKSAFFSFFSGVPLIVKSRGIKELQKNLERDNYPVLFEGIHTTFPLYKGFKHNTSKKIIRMHNIEPNYYLGLAKSDRNYLKKLFFYSEFVKLSHYDKIIEKADAIFPISTYETDYYKEHFPRLQVQYLPPFHENTEVTDLSDTKGNFALYHGDLSISDNIRSAVFLVDVFKKIDYPLVIAGNKLPKFLLQKITQSQNVTYVNLKNNREKLEKLFQNAQMNLLFTFQKTGIKLKLINSLYKSRFVVGNDLIRTDTGLEELIYRANTHEEFLKAIDALKDKKYSLKDHKAKIHVLNAMDVRQNVQQILEFLF